MRRIIFTLLAASATAAAIGQTANGQNNAPPAGVVASPAAAAAPQLQIKPDAPLKYKVKKGDTLSGLAAKFLKDPHRWPQLLRMNAAQIKNPHLIYPGQVLLLDLSGAAPGLLVASEVKLGPEVRSTILQEPIPSIPYHVIAPYLEQPLLLEEDDINTMSRVVATSEGHLAAGAGDVVFAGPDANPEEQKWHVFRIGETLTSPDRCEPLGIEAIHIGSATVAGPMGEVLPLRLTASEQEVLVGDYIMPAPPAESMTYTPHAPFWEIDAQVISIYNTLGDGALGSVISISAGKEEGLAPGHMLAIYHKSERVKSRLEVGGQITYYNLPEQRSGEIFIFRTFDKVSYALVTESTLPVTPGDLVRTPR